MQGKNKVSLIGMVLLLALMGCDDKGPLIVNDTDVYRRLALFWRR